MCGKTINKFILNTEIVSMRHLARRARVHVISKLVREAKKLRTKKGTDEQREKYQRKAARFAEELLIIKKLKDDDISRFALCNTQIAEEAIADVHGNMQTRALARFLNHKHLKMRVNEFRTKYPSWAETLPQLLPQLGAKRTKKIEKLKKQKAAEKTFVLKNGIIGDAKNSNDKENSSILEKNGLTDKQNLKKRSASEDISDFDHHNDYESDRKAELKVHKSSEIGEVKRFTELLQTENSLDDKECDFANGMNSSSEPSKDDPFFLHSDDERTAGTKREMEIPGKDKYLAIWNTTKKHGPNRRQRRQQLLSSKPENIGFKSFQHKAMKGSLSRDTELIPAEQKNKQKWKKEQHNAFQGNNMTVHPSWEAKRKLKEQQQTILVFQGKKTKFDDD